MGLLKKAKRLFKKIDNARRVGSYKIGIKLRPSGTNNPFRGPNDDLRRRWSEEGPN